MLLLAEGQMGKPGNSQKERSFENPRAMETSIFFVLQKLNQKFPII
jgi:hypothetical protein